jgi:uncharacterized RDD family membrane protein YckC
MNDQSCSTCPPIWERLWAFLIDFVGSAFVFGCIIAPFFKGLKEQTPALLHLFLIITYFIIMNKYFGWTFGKRILGIANYKKGKKI